MTHDERKWIRIEAEFRAGAKPTELYRKHGVSLRELTQRIRTGKWTRAAEPKAKPKAEPDKKPKREPKLTLPMVISERIEKIIEEEVADVIAAHRNMTRQLREHHQHELAEYQAMLDYVATFCAHDHIRELEAKTDTDGGKALREYLKAAMQSAGFKVRQLAQLTQIGRQIIEQERQVWGISDQSKAAEEQTYDDLLQVVHQKFQADDLPENVLEFDRKLAKAHLSLGA